MNTKLDYRIFVGAFPTGDLAERIQDVRQRYDPKTARITAPHVTLAGTYWRSGPPTPDHEANTIERLDAIKSQMQPFELVLGGVRTFPPRNIADRKRSIVIYLNVERTQGLLVARQALLQVLGPDKHRRFSPHLTLAMRLKGAAAQAMLSDLQDSQWDTQRWQLTIHELWLMQRGPDDPAWQAVARLPLDSKPNKTTR
jgi:2'-5' RNA ligase